MTKAIITEAVGSFRPGQEVQVKRGRNALFWEIYVNGEWVASLSSRYVRLSSDK